VDIFYPSAGVVFSKDGVFQQPEALALRTRSVSEMGDFSTTNASAFLQKGGNLMKILDEKERTAKISGPP